MGVPIQVLILSNINALLILAHTSETPATGRADINVLLHKFHLLIL